ncbi:MAG TPA: undecaprenyldiphospho-muramoylpentapeptide beta-N-acetylglucosaminyltransferase [Thermomicrobiaceae bacterium]|nr:undecaprenyldiphospho-muramoylpentapeptide beta-N-acetylglucosaminyltransferase [Thermomicrobiaceae bacterium]
MTERPFKLVIAGGGTGGHVQPAVATLDVLRQQVTLEPLWIGSRGGFERGAAAEAGIPFRAISTGKLRRYLSLNTVVDAVRVPAGVVQACLALRSFRPDAVFATGGFVSVPAVIAARMLGIPCLSHEQTATAGLATRINARFCDVIALAYAASADQLRGTRARLVVTGNPTRAALLSGDPATGRERFHFDAESPVVYVTGGVLGAHAINEAVRLTLPTLVEVTQVVHQCGPAAGNGDYQRLLEARERLPAARRARYAVEERFGPELADVFAAACLVVSRAGAGTIAELATLGKPSILIPLPGAGGDEQARNAAVLAEAGAAVLLPQRELTSERLLDVIHALVGDAERLRDMATRAREHGHGDAATRLAREVLSLADR